MQTQAQTEIHPFARFGAGPWRCIAVSETKHQDAPGCPVRAGGTCDVCGTCIMYVYTFRCSTGETFVTGCDCAQKAGAEYGKQCRTAMREWRSAVRGSITAAARAKVRAEREEAMRATVAKLREDHADWFEWCSVLEAEGDAFGRSIARDFVDVLGKGISLTEKQAELLAQIYRAHLRRNAGHFGEVGQRLKAMAVTYEGFAAYETSFGITRVYRFATLDGCTLVWKTSSGAITATADGYERPKIGAQVVITATIKAHGEYQGCKQTELSRVKQAWS